MNADVAGNPDFTPIDPAVVPRFADIAPIPLPILPSPRPERSGAAVTTHSL